MELIVSFTGYLIGGYGEKYIIVIGMFFFAVSILLDFDIKRDLVPFAIFGAYALVCYYFQHSAYILRIVLAIIAGRRQDARQVFKLFFYGTMAGMLYFGLLSMLGMHNSIYIEEVFRSVTERRYTFGFYHPNGYALFVFRIAMMGMYVYIDRMKWWAYLLYLMAFTGLIIPSKSKIGILTLVVGLLLFGFGRFINKKFTYVMCIASTVMVALFWLYIRFYGKIPWSQTSHDIWMLVDKITTGRSGNSSRAMLYNKPTPFGVGLGPVTSEMGIVDSIYCHGVIFMILFIFVSIIMYIKMIKRGNVAGVVIIAVTILYSIAESFLQYFNKNMIWMLCVGVLGGISVASGGDKNGKENNKN